MTPARQRIEEWLSEFQLEEVNVLLADGFDAAFIGIGERYHELIGGGVERIPVAIYSIDKCIEVLMEDGMSYEDADEYLSFNTLNAYVGVQTPIFVRVMTQPLASSEGFVSQARA